MGVFSGDGIGVDLGSANVGIYLDGEGVVLRESNSVLTLNDDMSKVIALGDEARMLLGRTAEDSMLFQPVIDGAVADVDIAALLILALTERVTGKRKPMEKVRLMMNMPVGLTKVEKLALVETAKATGSKRTILVKAPVAAALGAGLDIDQPRGTMVVCLGAGITEIALISMNGIVAARSIRSGSLSMDESIVRYVRREKNLIIGLRTAEDLKRDIGSAKLPDYTEVGDEPDVDAPDDDSESAEKEVVHLGEKVLLKGRDATTGLPATIEITTRDIALALAQPIEVLVDVMRDALARTNEELAADVLDSGIHISGGGALLFGLADVLREQTGVPISISEHPDEDVLLGIGRLLDDERMFRALVDAGSVEN